MLLVCSTCRGAVWAECGRTREDRCEHCAMKHNRRLKKLIASGFTGRPSNFFFNTLTAPGQTVLEWDTSQCSHPPDRPCSGKIGCRVHEMDAAMWNASAPQAWSWFMTALRRELAGHEVQFFKCWETQKRGVLHLHAVVWCPGVTAARMAAAWASAAALTWQIGSYGFSWGEQCDSRAIGSASSVPALMDLFDMTADEAEEAVSNDADEDRKRCVRYVAKYCTKGGERACVVNRRTGEIMRDGAGYRTWSASSRFGLRMKAIRAQQRDFMAAAGGDGMSDEVGRPRPGAGGALDPESHFYATSEICNRETGSVAALV